MTITAVVEKDMIKLPPGVHVADGTFVRIEILEARSNQWAPGYFERIAGALAGEEFVRLAQGRAPVRGDW